MSFHVKAGGFASAYAAHKHLLLSTQFYSCVPGCNLNMITMSALTWITQSVLMTTLSDCNLRFLRYATLFYVPIDASPCKKAHEDAISCDLYH